MIIDSHGHLIVLLTHIDSPIILCRIGVNPDTTIPIFFMCCHDSDIDACRGIHAQTITDDYGIITGSDCGEKLICFFRNFSISLITIQPLVNRSIHFCFQSDIRHQGHRSVYSCNRKMNGNDTIATGYVGDCISIITGYIPCVISAWRCIRITCNW